MRIPWFAGGEGLRERLSGTPSPGLVRRIVVRWGPGASLLLIFYLAARHPDALVLGGIVVAAVAWVLLSSDEGGFGRQIRQHERRQGRVEDREIARALRLPPAPQTGGLAIAPGLPLGYLARDRPLGLPWRSDAGHVAVIGPTRSGKSFHLTDTLLRWPGPAVCIDPKGEQWERTAGFRSRHYGPVYRLPPQGLDLAQLYPLDGDLALRELHEVLLRPWRDGAQRIFADKALPILEAAVAYGRARGEHPLRVAARWARMSPVLALQEAKAVAPAPVLTFTDGASPEKIGDNRFALSAWGTFSTRFSPFAAHLDTVTTAAVPAGWARANATIYVTYPLQSQVAVAPLAAAIVAGLTRQLLAEPPGTRTLFAIDEMPTVALPHLTSALATVGGAGITMVLYAQSVPQIEATYGREEAQSILSNCTSQVYFPPRDARTAELISQAYGSRLEVAEQFSRSAPADPWAPATTQSSASTRYRPALEVAEALALAAGTVVVFSQGLRHLARGSQAIVAGWLPQLPPPPPVVTVPPPAASVPAGSAAEPKKPQSYW